VSRSLVQRAARPVAVGLTVAGLAALAGCITTGTAQRDLDVAFQVFNAARGGGAETCDPVNFRAAEKELVEAEKFKKADDGRQMAVHARAALMLAEAARETTLREENQGDDGRCIPKFGAK